MFKPLSQLNNFFRLATERKLSGSDQLMYLHIFNKFNQAHWTETLRIKDAELKELLRLYDSNGKPASIETIRRGRQRLKAKGFIEVMTGDGQEPEYRLPCLPPADTPADTPADSRLVSYTRTREDVKDAKDLSDEREARAHASTSAGVNRNSEMDVHELWEYETGYTLTGSVAYELETLERTHGRESFHAALIKAVASKDTARLRFSYFKAVLERGGRKVERTSERDSTADFLGYDPN